MAMGNSTFNSNKDKQSALNVILKNADRRLILKDNATKP